MNQKGPVLQGFQPTVASAAGNSPIPSLGRSNQKIFLGWFQESWMFFESDPASTCVGFLTQLIVSRNTMVLFED